MFAPTSGLSRHSTKLAQIAAEWSRALLSVAAPVVRSFLLINIPQEPQPYPIHKRTSGMLRSVACVIE